MRQTVILAALLFGASGTVALADDIVVTGKPLKDTAAALEACLERKCPPDQDIAATLAHAENQFVAGDYAGSRSTLKKSLGRNRRNAGGYPVPVSDLLRANGRIADHMGEAKDFQLSVLDTRDVLKKGFGPDDFRVLVAQIEVGDSRAKLGFPDEAERIYGDVERRAVQLGQNRVASFARLRLALLARVRYEDSPNATLRARADERLRQLIEEPLPGAEEFVLAAEVLRAKLDRKDGRGQTTEALVQRFAQRGGADRPLLLYAEPIERIDLSKGWADGMAPPNTLNQLTALQGRGQWADVGFWIDASGHVTDIEVLRTGGEKSWLKPVIASIGKRVYAPLRNAGDGSPGFYMVERYTLTARFMEDVTGTHLRRREATPRIERLDLTPENWDAPKAG